MMFDLRSSERRARLPPARVSRRRRRSDAGRSRLPEAALAELRAAALGLDRPSISVLQRRISEICADKGLRVPARASLYNAFRRMEGRTYRVADLPEAVAASLYNLGPDSTLPGHQLAFHCLNYGPLSAMSFAAGLPWLDLHQASRLRGWRARSRGLLDAVMRLRGIR